MLKSVVSSLLFLLFALALAGCGGGGGVSIAPDPKIGQPAIGSPPNASSVIKLVSSHRDSFVKVEDASGATDIRLDTMLVVAKNHGFQGFAAVSELSEVPFSVQLFGHNPDWEIYRLESGSNYALNLTGGTSYHVFGIRQSGERVQLTKERFSTISPQDPAFLILQAGGSATVAWPIYQGRYARVFPFHGLEVGTSQYVYSDLPGAQSITVYERDGLTPVGGAIYPQAHERPNDVVFRPSPELRPNTVYRYAVAGSSIQTTVVDFKTGPGRF